MLVRLLYLFLIDFGQFYSNRFFTMALSCSIDNLVTNNGLECDLLAK